MHRPSISETTYFALRKPSWCTLATATLSFSTHRVTCWRSPCSADADAVSDWKLDYAAASTASAAIPAASTSERQANRIWDCLYMRIAAWYGKPVRHSVGDNATAAPSNLDFFYAIYDCHSPFSVLLDCNVDDKATKHTSRIVPMLITSTARIGNNNEHHPMKGLTHWRQSTPTDNANRCHDDWLHYLSRDTLSNLSSPNCLRPQIINRKIDTCHHQESPLETHRHRLGNE